MSLTHKLVELQGMSEIFLSRTAGFFTGKISYLAGEILCGGFVLSSRLSPCLLCTLPECSQVTSDGREHHLPLFSASVTILTVVMDILWMWLWQNWGHLHVRGKALPTAGRSTFASSAPRTAHLGHWPVSLVSTTESHLDALIYSPLCPSQPLF